MNDVIISCSAKQPNFNSTISVSYMRMLCNNNNNNNNNMYIYKTVI